MRTANNRASRPIGATVGLFFGGLWCVLGSQALPPHWRIPVIAAGWIVTAILILRLWRWSGADGGGTMFRQRAYLIAVALEIVGIAAANSLLPAAGLGDALIPAIGIIVGLHFLGLWKATGHLRFVAIAFAMCVVSLLSLLLPSAWGAIGPRIALCCFGNALVLWTGAGLAL